MKLKLLIALVTLTGTLAIAQNKHAIQKVYDSFEDHEEVLSFTLNQKCLICWTQILIGVKK